MLYVVCTFPAFQILRAMLIEVVSVIIIPCIKTYRSALANAQRYACAYIFIYIYKHIYAYVFMALKVIFEYIYIYMHIHKRKETYKKSK
jgi:hypothetical protein